ncbi:DegQ family serine endoprotease [Bosea sp. (in: a-proteobacteria)]
MFRIVGRLRPTLLAFCAALVLAGGLPSSAGGQPVLERRVERPTVAPVLARVTPSVVNIAVVAETPATSNPLYNDPYFRRFFELPEAPPPRQRMSAGSGVIIDAAKGHVLTNHHVVANAREIAVTLKDGRRLRAELVGSDQATDIALLKVEASNLVALEVGDSDTLQVGDYVVAIGNPFGLGQTVTSGIISALGRSGINNEGYEDFIQTDASINPGNSGGALVTLDGRLAGINTAILSPAGGNIGIGFAVPSNMAVSVMQQLIAHGEVRRGRLGVGIQDLTPDLAQALNLGDQRGAVIANVEPDSPAEKAGLRAGDVVTAVGGRAVHGATDLRNRVGLTPVGSRIDLTVKRSEGEKLISVTIAQEAAQSGNLSGTPFDGARLRDASREEARQLGAAAIVVESVLPGSSAARAGLRPGDMIVAINRAPVSSIQDLRRSVSGNRGTLAVELVRDGSRLLLIVR